MELGSGLLQCDYNNRSQFNYSIHLVSCNFFKLLKVGLPLSKRFLKLSISFTNCAIFHEKLRFEVNYAKSQHRRMSEALQKKWGHLMLLPSSFFFLTVKPPCATTSRKRLPFQNTKIFPVKSLQLEPLVNDHTL